MAFHDTSCPCGEKKPVDTMLCDSCVRHFADRHELATYQDPRVRVEFRRQAAIILITLARRRQLRCTASA